MSCFWETTVGNLHVFRREKIYSEVILFWLDRLPEA